MPDSARTIEAPTAGRAGAPTPEERAREVVLRYRTLDSDHRPPLMTMIADAIRDAETVARQQQPAPLRV